MKSPYPEIGLRYLVAALLMVAGIAVPWWMVTTLPERAADNLQRFIVPGEHDLVLANTGTYVIYHEYKTPLESGELSTPRDLAGFGGTLTRKDTGERVELRDIAQQAGYKLGESAGRPLVTFSIAEPGTLLLDVGFRQTARHPRAVIAVGEGLQARLQLGQFLAMALFLVCVMGGALLGASAHQRRQQQRAGSAS